MSDGRQDIDEWHQHALRERNDIISDAEFSTLRFNAMLFALANSGAIDKHKFMDILIQLCGGRAALKNPYTFKQIDECMMVASWAEGVARETPDWDPSFKFTGEKKK